MADNQSKIDQLAETNDQLRSQNAQLEEVNQRVTGILDFYQQDLADKTLKLADVTTQLKQAQAKLAAPATEE